MRNLSCAVNVRRRGRSKSSGDAAAGAETIVGLRPSSLSAPAAARVLLSLIWGITTGCLSYAPKGKLPAGVCLIIISTEGFIVFNAVLGAGHIIVLFSVGSYIALMPHVAGDLGGVFPSFGTWAQTLFIIALALAFPINRWLSGRFGDYR